MRRGSKDQHPAPEIRDVEGGPEKDPGVFVRNTARHGERDAGSRGGCLWEARYPAVDTRGKPPVHGKAIQGRHGDRARVRPPVALCHLHVQPVLAGDNGRDLARNLPLRKARYHRARVPCQSPRSPKRPAERSLLRNSGGISRGGRVSEAGTASHTHLGAPPPPPPPPLPSPHSTYRHRRVRTRVVYVQL